MLDCATSDHIATAEAFLSHWFCGRVPEAMEHLAPSARDGFAHMVLSDTMRTLRTRHGRLRELYTVFALPRYGPPEIRQTGMKILERARKDPALARWVMENSTEPYLGVLVFCLFERGALLCRVAVIDGKVAASDFGPDSLGPA